MDNRLETKIIERLDLLIKLTAAGILKSEKTLTDKVALLDSTGMGPVEIAKMLGTNSNNVSVTLNRIKRSKGAAKLEDKPSEESPTTKMGENT
jgi:hypothetical protein